MHQHLLPLGPLLLDQIARGAENGQQVLGRPVVLVEARRHDAHVQMGPERRGRQVRGHDCEDKGYVGGAEGVDVGGGEVAGGCRYIVLCENGKLALRFLFYFDFYVAGYGSGFSFCGVCVCVCVWGRGRKRERGKGKVRRSGKVRTRLGRGLAVFPSGRGRRWFTEKLEVNKKKTPPLF